MSTKKVLKTSRLFQIRDETEPESYKPFDQYLWYTAKINVEGNFMLTSLSHWLGRQNGFNLE